MSNNKINITNFNLHNILQNKIICMYSYLLHNIF